MHAETEALPTQACTEASAVLSFRAVQETRCADFLGLDCGGGGGGGRCCSLQGMSNIHGYALPQAMQLWWAGQPLMNSVYTIATLDISTVTTVTAFEGPVR